MFRMSVSMCVSETNNNSRNSCNLIVKKHLHIVELDVTQQFRVNDVD